MIELSTFVLEGAHEMRSKVSATVAVCCVLCACSGGGSALVQPDDGFAYPPVAATPEPTPATGRTRAGTEIVYPDPPQALPDGPSYQINGSLDLTGYRYAHAVGARGQGVTVAVVDSGVGAHPLLESAVLPGIDVTGDRLPGYAGDGRLDADGHGTAVAGLIASRGADRWPSMIGVAPASMIVPVRVESVNPSPGIDPRTVQQGVQAALDPARAAAAGYAAPRVVNLSLAAAAPSPALRDLVDNVHGRGALLVAAAGNDGRSSPDWPAAYAPVAGGHVIAVGAVDVNGTMPAWSNRAGEAKDYYLVAPGVDLVTTVPPSLVPPASQGLVIASGTSFATPVVAGAAAAVWSVWPYLQAPEVSGILLDTARDLGAPGPDEVYGRGLVDLEAALKPVGTTVLPQADGTRVAPVLAVDALLAPALQAQGREVMVFDQYRRHFAVPLGQLVAARSDGTAPLTLPQGDGRRVGHPSQGLWFSGAWQTDTQGRSRWQGQWGLTAGRWALTWWNGDAPPTPPQGDDGLALRLPGWTQVSQGWLNAKQSVQGVTGGVQVGAWHLSLSYKEARLAGWTHGEHRMALGWGDGRWRLLGYAAVSDRIWWAGTHGATVHGGASAAYRTVAGEWMVAWRAGRARQSITPSHGDLRLRWQGLALAWQATDVWRWGDRLALGMSQPLTLPHGEATLQLPTGVDMATGQAQFETVRLPLRYRTPWQWEAAWITPMAPHANLAAAVVLPVNGRGAQALLRYQRAF
jgi:hypothetical protein